jgi:putative transposase
MVFSFIKTYALLYNGIEKRWFDMANKAYKFRFYPTQEQLLAKTFGCVRFVYNKMLAERKETYEQFKNDKKALKKQKSPTPAKYKKEFVWLKEVDSLALANARAKLAEGIQKFLFRPC